MSGVDMLRSEVNGMEVGSWKDADEERRKEVEAKRARFQTYTTFAKLGNFWVSSPLFTFQSET